MDRYEEKHRLMDEIAKLQALADEFKDGPARKALVDLIEAIQRDLDNMKRG